MENMNRFRKFVSYYKPYKATFFWDLFFSVLSAGAALLFPLLARRITHDILVNSPPDGEERIFMTGFFLLLTLLTFIGSNMYYAYFGHVMGAKMEKDMRAELFSHYQRLSFSFYDEKRAGILSSVLVNDTLFMSELFHHGPEDLFISSIKFIGTLSILLVINAWLGLIILAFLPLVIWYALYTNKKMQGAYVRNRERIGDINATLEDSLLGMETVQAFAGAEQEMKKFQKENLRHLENRKDVYKNEVYYYEVFEAFGEMLSLVILVAGGLAVLHQRMPLSDLLSFILYVGVLHDPIKRLTNFTRLYQEGKSGFDRYMDILEIAPDITDAPDAKELQNVRGEIEFQNVSFRYKDGGSDVLQNLSLTARPGEFLALVGTSGVGKSTFCSLIPRFYDPTEGCVLIDGQDIKGFTLKSLRENIGIVQQDTYLFYGSVLENIRYGRPDATLEEVEQAARRANAHDFILSLKDGYDTEVGPRGVRLSGGQRQRISIARVFLKNPPILILDEATSSLDAIAEKAVQSALLELIKDRTALVIAHRLSTIKSASRILVLENGRVCEEGTHEALIEKKGAYAALYRE